MTAETSSFDPYRSPPLPKVEYPASPPRGRTGWLSALCVLCIVLGALGLMNSVFGTVGLIAGPSFQRFMAAQPQPGMPDDLKDAQQKMQEDMYKIQTKYIWPLGISILLRVIVCGLLLVAGIQSLNLSESGRKLLVVACSVALVFDLLQAIFQMVITVENMTVMNEFMESMATKAPNATKELESFMRAFGVFIRFFSLALICAIALAKIGLYVFSILYLQKPHIIALFQNTPAPQTNLTPVS